MLSFHIEQRRSLSRHRMLRRIPCCWLITVGASVTTRAYSSCILRSISINKCSRLKYSENFPNQDLLIESQYSQFLSWRLGTWLQEKPLKTLNGQPYFIELIFCRSWFTFGLFGLSLMNSERLSSALSFAPTCT